DTDLICVCVHPSATATALVAYDASVEIVSPHPQGKRTIKLEKLFLKPVNDPTRENHLQPGEIIEAVLVPAPAAGARSAYKKLKEKETFDWPLVESGVALDLSGGTIRNARVVLGHVAQVPWRAKEAEAILNGQKPTPELIHRASAAAVAGAKPL